MVFSTLFDVIPYQILLAIFKLLSNDKLLLLSLVESHHGFISTLVDSLLFKNVIILPGYLPNKITINNYIPYENLNSNSKLNNNYIINQNNQNKNIINQSLFKIRFNDLFKNSYLNEKILNFAKFVNFLFKNDDFIDYKMTDFFNFYNKNFQDNNCLLKFNNLKAIKINYLENRLLYFNIDEYINFFFHYLKKLYPNDSFIFSKQIIYGSFKFDNLNLNPNEIKNLNTLTISSHSKFFNNYYSYSDRCNFNEFHELNDYNHYYNNNNYRNVFQNINQLTNLNYLNISNNYKIDKIENLNNLVNLRVLILKFNNILRIENIENLHNLKILNLKGNRIINIGNLQNLKNLQILNLSLNRIPELNQNLLNLTNLKIFNISNNLIYKIENINNFQKLIELDLSDNKINFVQNLDNLKCLQKLNLKGNYISQLDMSDFKDFKNLKEINLKFNRLNRLYHSNKSRSFEKSNQLKKISILY
ncbi:L domain-like protein [Ascoidea rubescens DSM 1968]|uniref:L domain-like protein n=1 Tax=Ascoidea rubescens DSM 1968 TaxID=1344418 RepID=A0A1D2VBU4_9ASCO|nr:L domain-like protein [Ascoidea rubescens DSM 1968]ODV58953.1 L domain-like protein [Ascoidea rubescens DSM 1968]